MEDMNYLRVIGGMLLGICILVGAMTLIYLAIHGNLK